MAFTSSCCVSSCLRILRLATGPSYSKEEALGNLHKQALALKVPNLFKAFVGVPILFLHGFSKGLYPFVKGSYPLRGIRNLELFLSFHRGSLKKDRNPFEMPSKTDRTRFYEAFQQDV